jgi:hypothetical protein
MDYTIYPYQGIGPIQFGMTPPQVHERLGEPSEQMARRRFPDLPTDIYNQFGLFVFYQSPGVCEAMSLSINPNLSFQGFTFINKSLKELRNWLRSINSDIQYFDIGFISLKYGLTFSSQFYNSELNCLVDTLIVFKFGYYDDIAHIHAKYPREEAKV